MMMRMGMRQSIQLPVLVAVSELVNGTFSLTVDDEAVELAEPIDGVAT